MRTVGPHGTLRAVVGDSSGLEEQSLEGFILAGGAASRMGTDKAQLQLGGQTFAERIAEALRHVTQRITVVGNAPTVLPGYSAVKDVFPHWGALGGLHASLDVCRSEWALVVACDLPFVTSALLARLIGYRDHFDAVVPVQKDGRTQPLCALYRTGICRESVVKLIRSGERRPLGLLQSIRTRWITFAELADLAGANDFFNNINTPADYVRACELIKEQT